MIRISINVEGHVQGVGFRYFTTLIAENHHIKGWVRNKENGDVEIEAEGEIHNLKGFINNIRKGPRFARVDNVTIRELETIHGYDKFKQIY
ncbi:acylphosphatase [Bacillus massiliigorillae]|uniref:acylphosphatase n=1 Tax=Bacillus massiliigorillae TaxID=1243664 RepID=UPI0003A82B50|nr:acylphosphatase [Bacillus massiliigorillae]